MRTFRSALAGAPIFPGSPLPRGAAVIALLLPTFGFAAENAAAQSIPDHSTFTEVLRNVVEFPRVDYERLEGQRVTLDRYMHELARTDSGELARADREAQLAFWINAYNACMLQLVADHYPIEARGVGMVQWFRNMATSRPRNSVWWIRDVFDGEFCEVAGSMRSLDEIEHEIIRPRYQEPRIHFAVNCAAVSCPPLWEEAYVPEDLEAQLQRATRNFVNDPAHFLLEEEPGPTLRLNRIVDWFSEDFGEEEGTKEFFAELVDEETREILLHPDTRIEFFEYDWTLNDVDR